MFGHILINRLKCIVRDRPLIFWTLAFPLIMALFFSLAFSNIGKSESFEAFPIAVVQNEEYRGDRAFQTALEGVTEGSAGTGTKLFRVTLATNEKADQLLRDGDIRGYILFEDGAHVVVKDSGIQQTILKAFVDNYLQASSAYKTILEGDPARARFIEYSGDRTFLKTVSPNDKPANQLLVNYYALIAMAVLFGSFFGKNEVDHIQANFSARGARMNLAPVPKMKYFGYSMSVALLVQFLSLILLIAFMAFVLKVDFGGQVGYILLTCLVGSTTGISMGALIGVLVKGGKGIAVLISVGLILSSAAGLQNANLKYLITHNVPALAYINPANLIADAFYSLYYYTTYERYFLSIGLLAAFSALFFIIVVLLTRRQRYASL
jgi:ABC-2 type transport system permease protein